VTKTLENYNACAKHYGFSASRRNRIMLSGNVCCSLNVVRASSKELYHGDCLRM
jgi:hypothetical protein